MAKHDCQTNANGTNWTICECGGRVHAAGCKSRRDPTRDCTHARHKAWEDAERAKARDAMTPGDLIKNRFKWKKEKLAAELHALAEQLTYAAKRLEAFDIEAEAQRPHSLCLPVNELGILQARGPAIDNACEELSGLYGALRDVLGVSRVLGG